MKIELTDNKVFFEKQGAKKEIHPFWLRERVNSENFLDQKTQQRLFDPTMLKNSSEISKVNISDKFLEISFKDGAYAKLVIENILKEFEKDNELYFVNKISWKSDFQNNNIYKFNKNFFAISFLINFSKALSEVVTGSNPLPLNLFETLKVLLSFE